MEPISIMEVLSDLGLAHTEAKILTIMTETGPATAKTIAKASGVAREIVYQTMTKLKEKGLVEEILATPKKFKAIPTEECLLFLLQSKKEEQNRLNKKLKVTLSALKETKLNQPQETEQYQFVFIPQKKAVVNRISQAIANAQQTVDVILSWRRFAQTIDAIFADAKQKALQRGVKLRIILESPKEANAIEYLDKLCKSNPDCHIKFIPSHPKTVLGLYDGKEVFIITEPTKDISDSPALWSNNPSLTSIVKDYFEMLWLTAMDYPLASCE